MMTIEFEPTWECPNCYADNAESRGECWNCQEERMTDPFQQQIDDMDPETWARTARRAAAISARLSKASGIPLPADIQRLLDTPCPTCGRLENIMCSSSYHLAKP